MNFQRRNLLRLAGGAAALPLVSRAAWAQAYPTRPVRVLVGYSAGGGVDIAGRMIAQWLSDRLGQQFVVENRTGASTNIATEAVIRSPADGYMLLLANAANAINPSFFDNLSFNFVKDAEPVGAIMRVPFVMVVHPSFPAKTVPELIAYAKANPGKVNIGNGGVGGPDHASGELFKMLTGTQMQQVPYRGLSPALTDLLGGTVQLVFSTVPAAIGYIKAGTLRPMAVTSTTRNEALPNMPPVADFVPGFDSSQWYGLVASKGTPAAIVAKINKEVQAGLVDPKLKKRLADLGGVAMPMTAGEFGKFIASETDKWAKVLKFAATTKKK